MPLRVDTVRDGPPWPGESSLTLTCDRCGATEEHRDPAGFAPQWSAAMRSGWKETRPDGLRLFRVSGMLGEGRAGPAGA